MNIMIATYPSVTHLYYVALSFAKLINQYTYLVVSKPNAVTKPRDVSIEHRYSNVNLSSRIPISLCEDIVNEEDEVFCCSSTSFHLKSFPSDNDAFNRVSSSHKIM